MPRTRRLFDFVSRFSPPRLATPNRIGLAALASTTDRDAPVPSDVTSDDPLAAVSANTGLLTGFLVVLALSAATLALLSAQSVAPIVLTAMAILAMLGVFFVFGLVAGHIRISQRIEEGIGDGIEAPAV